VETYCGLEAGVFGAGSAARRVVVGSVVGFDAVFGATSFFAVVAGFFGAAEVELEAGFFGAAEVELVAAFFAGGGGAGGLGLDAGGVVPALMIEERLEQEQCQCPGADIFQCYAAARIAPEPRKGRWARSAQTVLRDSSSMTVG
jgi:hypothetical protein